MRIVANNFDCEEPEAVKNMIRKPPPKRQRQLNGRVPTQELNPKHQTLSTKP